MIISYINGFRNKKPKQPPGHYYTHYFPQPRWPPTQRENPHEIIHFLLKSSNVGVFCLVHPQRLETLQKWQIFCCFPSINAQSLLLPHSSFSPVFSFFCRSECCRFGSHLDLIFLTLWLGGSTKWYSHVRMLILSFPIPLVWDTVTILFSLW